MAKVNKQRVYNVGDKVQVDLISIIPSLFSNSSYIRTINLTTIVEGTINSIGNGYCIVHLDIKDCEHKVAAIHSKLNGSIGMRPLRDKVGEDYHTFHTNSWKIDIHPDFIINNPKRKTPSLAVYKDNEYKVIAREICNKRYYDLIDKEGNKFKTVPKKDKNLKFKQENVNTK